MPNFWVRAGRSLRRAIADNWRMYVLLLPAIIYIAIFEYAPMYGVQIAFRDYRPSRGITGSDWVGLKHFFRFVSHPNFIKMLRNTLSITLYSLCTFPLPIILALMLNEVRAVKLKKTVQMVSYAPHFMSDVVVCSLVLMMLDRANGPINNLIALLGGKRTSFISFPQYFSSIYVWSGMWQNMGWDSILYVSALANISVELIEAARIDGANRMQVIRYVNLPGILPTVAIAFIMRAGGLLSVGYSKIFLLQNDLNIEASQVISTYVYNIGLIDAQYSYSSAIGLFNNIVNILILLFVNRIVKSVSETGLF